METQVITRKIQININENDKDLRMDYWKLLNDYNYITRKCANMVATEQYFVRNILQTEIYLDPDFKGKLLDKRKDENGVLNTSSANITYRVISNHFKGKIPMASATAVNSLVEKKIKNDWLEISKGEMSLPSFRNTFPIQLPKQAIRNMKWDEEKNNLTFMAFNIPFITRFGRDRSDNRTIVKRILNGKYSMCDSSISFSPLKGKKTFFLLTVKIPVQENKPIPGRVLGMNLGLVHPAVVCTNFSDHPMFIGDYSEFFHKRRQIQEGLLRAKKAARYNQGGKGKKKKVKSVARFKKLERNYVNTKNHQYSKMIVNFAVKNKCETIYLEDFKGIARDEDYFSKLVLRNWSYYELQQYIIYKAKLSGIRTVIVKPKNMSRKCISCGHTHEKNRIGLQQFKCQSCGYENYSDYVHAWNMARVEIKKKDL